MVFHQATRDVIIKETRILLMFTTDNDISHIQKRCIFTYFFLADVQMMWEIPSPKIISEGKLFFMEALDPKSAYR